MMRKTLAVLMFFVTPTSVFSEPQSPMEDMCFILQQSTTTSLIAIQDMGLELSEILMEDLDTDGARAILESKDVLDQGFESFREVLKLAVRAQTICKEHYEPVFVQTIQAMS